ncbi:hypothetical protein LTR91_003144 [Friedmanniomyces endolithicus]|uniref:DRBM domain-containing protein n=1 Tax=Friedmanniomyces endolithicus TaxID=329885 RepID=A0AAN6J3P7_9PEZI|nr:hypothetical protein LTS00_015991 [Friedmanniomyces endolithicus]KAK0274238.1 hypothetical protein LTR35_011747 [Friedmanniomyces endolithicus]KAK0311767.1 hypothetical protein LTR82_014139 [Friedmanniomyces endolithicus]KAK0902623.1 hypothetical protein LTR57_019559 [Friedmanniomyces endolithicus]KAK0983623.1 hypothetical protein LTR54_014288 [Friedmanniomyces endolithicus]
MAEVGPGRSNANRDQNMSASSGLHAPSFEIEGMSRPANHINVEEHIHEASDDDMDLQDIDDWERENPRQEKHKFVPATLQTVKVHTDYTTENHKPVASQVAKYNPEIVAKLQSLCWERGLTASFDIVETAPRLFAASVSFAGQTVNSEGSFTAKRLAKENVCRLAIPIVEQFDPNSTKRKESSDEGMPVDRITEDELNGSNWAGTLQNFTQGHKLPMPDFTEFRTPYVPHLFSCTVRLASSLDTNFFGSETTLYPTKSAAKKAAAREAVLWIRSQGFIFKEAQVTGGPSTPSMKRQTSLVATPTPTTPGAFTTGLTQNVLREVDMNKLAHLSLAQQVHEAVILMGFSQPEWRATPSGDGAFGASYVDMAAHFSILDVQKEPRLAGPICKVERVFGKKQAKEQCCERVLSFLKELKPQS